MAVQRTPIQHVIVTYPKAKKDKQGFKLPWYGRWSNRLQVFVTAIFLILEVGLFTTGFIMILINKPMQRSEIKAFFNNMQFHGYLTLGNVINSLPLLCINVGGVVPVFVALGCYGRVKKNQIILTLFSVLLVWFFIVQVLTTVMWVMVREKFQNEVKQEMIEMFPLYEGIQSTTEISNSWDAIFIEYECCGVEGITYTDDSYAFNVTQWWGTRDSDLILVPTSCCSRATEDNYMTYTDTACENVLVTHHKKGCYDAIVDWQEYFWRPAIVFSAMLIPVEVILVCLSCVMCCAVRKAKQIT